ncbi:MAG: hypothetical protein ACLGSD_00590 [Acidobacteriota bacterium]
MAGQLLRISDFERHPAPQLVRARKAEVRGRVFEFPAALPTKKKKSSVRAWRRGLDIALRIEFGCVLLLTAVWLLWHFIR